jgi:phosphohistidine phosphatase
VELILWRHADAEDGKPDLGRELTDKGRRQASRMAKWLKPRLEGDWEILVSPAIRAQQTVQALERDFRTRITVGPQSTEDTLLREVEWPARKCNVIVVGHQPAFGRVAAQLLTGHRGDLSVRKGSIWWFSSKLDEEMGLGETVLRAVLSPDLAD